MRHRRCRLRPRPAKPQLAQWGSGRLPPRRAWAQQRRAAIKPEAGEIAEDDPPGGSDRTEVAAAGGGAGLTVRAVDLRVFRGGEEVVRACWLFCRRWVIRLAIDPVAFLGFFGQGNHVPGREGLGIAG